MSILLYLHSGSKHKCLFFQAKYDMDLPHLNNMLIHFYLFQQVCAFLILLILRANEHKIMCALLNVSSHKQPLEVFISIFY